ncbi:hypothetical protein C8J57DRAFT_1291986 [Mycena rebaudengoi]|nr:hypothetical protein C8J57DRAFT_1291986 [Mycena rebaudengoi]
MSAAPLVTGYYRYTDIQFFDAPDSLTHPEHPLHVEGVEGIALFLGTRHNGELRLLFSSRQLHRMHLGRFIRYWLHATSLTPGTIPLPRSEHLLTVGADGDLLNVSPVVYKDGHALKLALKQIPKNNKRLKHSGDLLGRRVQFERVRALWGARTGVWCALDFEDWVGDHTVVLEFGYSYVGWANGDEERADAHFRMNKHYRNTGQYGIPDNSEPRSPSLFSDLRERYGPVFLVFHDSGNDIKFSHVLPETPPSDGLFVVDTAGLFGALEGEAHNKRKLEQVCHHLKVGPLKDLHNAGN